MKSQPNEQGKKHVADAQRLDHIATSYWI
jgi:hypothetical protein